MEDLAGALKEYARPVNLDQAKEEAWEEAIREKDYQIASFDRDVSKGSFHETS